MTGMTEFVVVLKQKNREGQYVEFSREVISKGLCSESTHCTLVYNFEYEEVQS